MKLVLAIVSNDDATAVSAALMENNFYMTKLATTEHHFHCWYRR